MILRPFSFNSSGANNQATAATININDSGLVTNTLGWVPFNLSNFLIAMDHSSHSIWFFGFASIYIFKQQGKKLNDVLELL